MPVEGGSVVPIYYCSSFGCRHSHLSSSKAKVRLVTGMQIASESTLRREHNEHEQEIERKHIYMQNSSKSRGLYSDEGQKTIRRCLTGARPSYISSMKRLNKRGTASRILEAIVRARTASHSRSPAAPWTNRTRGRSPRLGYEGESKKLQLRIG